MICALIWYFVYVQSWVWLGICIVIWGFPLVCRLGLGLALYYGNVTDMTVGLRLGITNLFIFFALLCDIPHPLIVSISV